MVIFAVFLNSKRTCVSSLGGGSLRPLSLQSRGLNSARSRSVWLPNLWILEAGSVCQEGFSFWCVAFITRLAITPQVESSHVICVMSQNWSPVIRKCCFCSLTLVFVDCRAATFVVWLRSPLVRSCVLFGGVSSLCCWDGPVSKTAPPLREQVKGFWCGISGSLDSVEQPDNRTGRISLEPCVCSIPDAVYSSAAAHLWRSRTGNRAN